MGVLAIDYCMKITAIHLLLEDACLQRLVKRLNLRQIVAGMFITLQDYLTMKLSFLLSPET